MKVHPYRFLKYCTTLLVLLLLVTNCEKDSIIEQFPQEPNFVETLSFEQLQNDKKFSEAFKAFKLNTLDQKFNKSFSNTQKTEDYTPNFSIDLSTINKIEKEHATTYTFIVDDDAELPPFAFKNLVLEVTEEQTHGYFITYYPTQDYIRNKIYDENTEFETHISVTPFEEDIEALLNYITQSQSDNSNATTSYGSDCKKYYVIETICAANKHWPGESCQLTGSQRAQSYYFWVLDDGCYSNVDGGGNFVGPPINLNGNQNVSSGSGLGGSNTPGFHTGSTVPNTPAGIGGINSNLLQVLLDFNPSGYYPNSHYFNYLKNVSSFANTTGALDLGTLLHNYGGNSTLTNDQLEQVAQKAKEILAIMAKNNFVGIDQYTTTEQEIIARNSLFIGFLPSMVGLHLELPDTPEEWKEFADIFIEVMKEVVPDLIPGISELNSLKNSIEAFNQSDYSGATLELASAMVGILPVGKALKLIKKAGKLIGKSTKIFKIYIKLYKLNKPLARGFKKVIKDSNKMSHIFDPKHKLTNLVNKTGGEKEALLKAVNKVQELGLDNQISAGTFQKFTNIDVFGELVTINLFKDASGDIVRISNMFKP